MAQPVPVLALVLALVVVLLVLVFPALLQVLALLPLAFLCAAAIGHHWSRTLRKFGCCIRRR